MGQGSWGSRGERAPPWWRRRRRRIGLGRVKAHGSSRAGRGGRRKMIRLTHLSGRMQGTSSTSPKAEMQPSADAASLAREAQMKIAQARVMSGGQPSGQTMFIMADTLKKVEQVTQKKSGKKWKKVVLTVVLLAFAGFGGLGVIIWEQ